jgi:UDP-N-acetylglucosamine 2-epimerase (non-hydrolysing)
MKIAVVVGTRPEIIKMAPVIHELSKARVDYTLIHSNQHYSDNMDAIFFRELGLPEPHYNLQVGSGSHSNQLGNILIKIEPILQEIKPDVLLAQGDTNTVAAAALAAHKLGIKVGHIEAGLRSYDRTMPEESNRVVTDHVSDFLFAVTNLQKEILLKEGIAPEKIFVVGNTIVDAVYQNRDLAAQRSRILKTMGLAEGKYYLFTVHRAGNVDTLPGLSEVLSLLGSLDLPVVWPMHVRTKKRILEYELMLPDNVVASDPLGYFDFLQLLSNAKSVLTDSGGVQEEACILGVPCITLRENTERPETLQVGANVLVGRDPAKLREALRQPRAKWSSPFGEGDTAQRIVRVLREQLGEGLRIKDVAVVGMGYMGLPTALLLARAGFHVSGFDIDAAKVGSLKRGVCPFDEIGLPELLQEGIVGGRFSVDTTLNPADAYIIAVPTPHENRKCDLSMVVAASEAVATVAKDGDLIIIESTIKPNTCKKIIGPIFEKAGKKVDLVHCPERAIPGNTLHELSHNDRIIGGATISAARRAEMLYRRFVKGKTFVTDVTTAEAVKLMENTFRDVNIALANELSLISEDLGIDVWEAIALANRHPRVKILQPGPGVGGHCIAIDPWFLIEDVKDCQLITAAREINDRMPDVVVDRFYKLFRGEPPQKIGVLGLAYKANIDDARETPSERIIHRLKEDGHTVRAHDPHVKNWPEAVARDLVEFEAWADAFILVTDHEEYASFETKKVVLDTRNLLGQ